MTITGSFYSKSRPLRHLVYKLSASSDLSYGTPNQTPSAYEYSSPRTGIVNTYFHAISGSYGNRTIYSPHSFAIDVPEYGKIRDVKVWVELIHDIRGGTGTLTGSFGGTGLATSNLKQGLQGIQIALRSPNVSFHSAHPLWNDPRLTGLGKQAANPLFSQDLTVPELYRSSYLLWAGHTCENDLGETLGNATSSLPDVYFSTSSIDSRDLTNADVTLYGAFGRSITIKNDKQNFPRVAYTTGSGASQGLWHAYFDSQGWHQEQIEDGIFGGRKSFVALDIDSNSRTHVVNFRNAASLTHYVGMTGAWSAETFGNSFEFAGAPSLKIGQDDTVHVAGFEQGNGVVFYRKTSGSWSKETVFASISSSQNFSTDEVVQMAVVDLDSDGAPHVVFCLVDNAHIYHAVSSSQGWNVEEMFDVPEFVRFNFDGVNTTGSQILTLDFCLGQDNSKYVTFVKNQDATHQNVYFVHSASSGVRVKNISKKILGSVELTSSEGLCSSIFLDRATGRPLISYVESDFGSTQYYYVVAKMNEFDDFDVFSKHVVNKSTAAFFPAIHASSDSFGNPHVVFLTDNLRYGYVSSSLKNSQSGYTITKRSLSSSCYHSFGTDIDIRTVFSDSSRNLNPRHNMTLGQENPTYKLIRGGLYESPSKRARDYQFHGLLKNIPVSYEVDHFLTGSNIPWFIDPRIPAGRLYGMGFTSMTSSEGVVSATNFSPPTGWLTGPGGTANSGEFATTGSQIGPEDIRPLYPLLDDVYVVKSVDHLSRTERVAFPLVRPQNLKGFRPGLRGTEIHGKWQLLIGNADKLDVMGNRVGGDRDGFWFRQFRIEFIVDTGEDTVESSNNGFNLRFKNVKRGSSTRPAKQIEVVSGSAWWDIGRNDVYVASANDTSRNYGITSDTGSLNYAVFAQITGSRLEAISGSGGSVTDVRRTFLANEFGTPYIPDSSGSQDSVLSPITVDEAKKVREIVDSVLSPRPLIARNDTLEATISRTSAGSSTREEILKKILDEE